MIYLFDSLSNNGFGRLPIHFGGYFDNEILSPPTHGIQEISCQMLCNCQRMFSDIHSIREFRVLHLLEHCVDTQPGYIWPCVRFIDLKEHRRNERARHMIVLLSTPNASHQTVFLILIFVVVTFDLCMPACTEDRSVFEFGYYF